MVATIINTMIMSGIVMRMGVKTLSRFGGTFVTVESVTTVVEL